MNKNTKNILIASGVAAVTAIAAGLAHRAILKGLMDVALARKEPRAMAKSKEKIMGSDELSNVIGKVMDAAKALESEDHEIVEIEAYDGIRLVGHWFPAENPKRVLVAMHGWRTSWSQDFGLIADFWRSNGCSVLFAEQRGQGESGGEYMGFGLLERYDCLEWVKWADENTENIPIYLCGLSMGATTILMTAGFDLPERVHGIMADCAFTSPHAIWRHVVQTNLHLPYGLYSAAARDICRKKIQVGSDEYSCPEALKNCKVPVLFIHGSDDTFVPVEMTYENYKACPSAKHLVIVPGADHGLSYLVDREGYERAGVKFWRCYDEKIPEMPASTESEE